MRPGRGGWQAKSTRPGRHGLARAARKAREEQRRAKVTKADVLDAAAKLDERDALPDADALQTAPADAAEVLVPADRPATAAPTLESINAGIRENVEQAEAARTAEPFVAGRNEPCPCKSGKKFKRCHGLPPAFEGPAIAPTPIVDGELVNPNEGNAPIPLMPDAIAALAKAGCGTCHGAGAYVLTAKRMKQAAFGTIQEKIASTQRELCHCAAKKIRARTDIVDYGGQICWAPKKAPPGLVVRPREAAAS